MTWHSSTIPRAHLDRLLSEIRHQGGVIASCQRCQAGMLVTWFTR